MVCSVCTIQYPLYILPRWASLQILDTDMVIPRIGLNGNSVQKYYQCMWVCILYFANMQSNLNILWDSKVKYRQTSNISHTLVVINIVNHSDVVGASPVGAAPITSSLST